MQGEPGYSYDDEDAPEALEGSGEPPKTETDKSSSFSPQMCLLSALTCFVFAMFVWLHGNLFFLIYLKRIKQHPKTSRFVNFYYLKLKTILMFF